MIFNKINKLGRDRVPFFFSIDFAVKNAIIFPLEDLSKEGICIYFNGKSYGDILNIISHNKYNISFKYISLDNYRESFNKVQEGINNGDSYLLNLTFPTEAISDISLEEVYLAANAKYKVYVKDKFVFFSPESFIKIYDNKIFSYPMKGTIDASIPSAELLLLDNEKELFEHYTIVDLIRNDLSLVSSNVGVEKFRYIDKVKTANGRDILQTSSKISGDIDSNWKDNIGNILKELLPAGSISGAPKLKTLEIYVSSGFNLSIKTLNAIM